MNDDTGQRIARFAAEAATRSRLPPDLAEEGRGELESHLHEATRARSGGGPVTMAHVEQAIAGLGREPDIDATFFAPLRRERGSGAAQRPKSPGPAATSMWGPRVGAALVDGLLLLLVGLALAAGAEATACVGLDPCHVETRLWPLPDADSVAGWGASTPEGVQRALDASAAAESRADLVLWLLVLYLLVAPVAYFTWCESRYGATVGKRAMGLQVETLEGGRPDAWTALGRSASKVVLPFPFLIPILLVVDIAVGRVWGNHADRITATWTQTRVARRPVHQAAPAGAVPE